MMPKKRPMPRMAKAPDNRQCVYCFVWLAPENVTKDHFYPSQYRKTNRIQSPKYICCETCNKIKGANVFTTIEDARQYIKNRCEQIVKSINANTSIVRPQV